MNKQLILKTDILDIIFENRNKGYGAYNLRKYYPARLMKAMGFMLIMAAAFSAIVFFTGKAVTSGHIVYVMPEPGLTEVDITPKEPKKEPVKQPETKIEIPKPAVSPLLVPNQKAFTSNLRIVDQTEKSDTISTLLPTDNISTVNTAPSAPVLVPITPVKPETGTTGNSKPETKVDKTTPRHADAVDVLPSYPGGADALRKFLEKNLQNPYDLENGETVKVQIRFVVGYNGKLEGFVTVLDGGEMYNKEVIRVLKKMPDWNSGIAKGEKVSVYFTIPVKFVMSN